MPEHSVSGKSLWAAALAGFIVLTLVLSAYSGADEPRLLYLWMLAATCSSPYLFMDRINGRHAMLSIIMAVYFVLYGASDLLALLIGAPVQSRGVMDATEAAIVVGAVFLIAGYVVAARRTPTRSVTTLREWSSTLIFWIGMTLWTLGVLATLYWQVKLQKRGFDLEYVSPALGMLVTLGRMAQPLGTALMAYRTVRSGGAWGLLLMAALLATEFVVGFVCDSKELSIRGLIIFLGTKLMLQGRIPKAWMIVAGLVVVLSFPVFQAYRHEVLGVRGQAREQAARNFAENLQIAVQSIAAPSAYGSNAGPGFIGRVSLKANIALVLERVGSEAAYQQGRTYLLFLQGLVPRVLWADKPDTSVGQLFNRELHISNFRDVYISPSFLGEMYWNFGWAGIIAGMCLLGSLLGLVGARFAMSEGVTVTRFLVTLLTIYAFCMRFEGGLALEALVWVRSLLAVALLHWLCARTQIDSTALREQGAVSAATAAAHHRLANLMH